MHVEKLLELNGHNGAIYTVDHLEKFIFTGSGDRFVAKWNLKTGIQEAFSIRCDQAIYQIKLICNKTILLIGTSSGAIHVINLSDRKEIKHFIAHNVAIFAFEEILEINQFYVGDANGNLSVWNSLSWEMMLFLPLNVGKIRCIRISNDRKSIYLACQDGTIRQFDTKNFNEINCWQAHDTGANSIIESQDNKLYSAGKDGYIRIWELGSPPLCIKQIPAHNFGIYDLLFMQNGKSMLSISRDKSIKLWDIDSMKVIQKLERKHGGHSHAVNAITKISETEFVSVGDDKRLIYWDIIE